MSGGLPAELADEQYCYLTTTGRVTGRPHTIEIWFGVQGGSLYVMSGGRDRSDWVRNLARTPETRVRIGDREFAGRARLVEGTDEDALARRLLLSKYASTYAGDLTDWGQTALPVAIDLEVVEP